MFQKPFEKIKEQSAYQILSFLLAFDIQYVRRFWLQRVFDSSGRLARLLDYTEGEANNLIQGCVFRVNDGYEHAKNLLKRRFGDPHRVMNFYRKALENYNVIKPGDSASFENFYSFLLRCGSLIEENLWNGFDSVDNLCLIVSKLPLYSRDKWNRLVLSLRKREFREPCFKDILNFVEEEMMVANDPLFSREALQERFPSKTSSRDKPTNPSFRKPVSTFATCFSCKADHDLELCPHYSKLPLKDKTRWLLKQRLCFGCLGRGHISSDCKNKRICNVCKKKIQHLYMALFHRKYLLRVLLIAKVLKTKLRRQKILIVIHKQ